MTHAVPKLCKMKCFGNAANIKGHIHHQPETTKRSANSDWMKKITQLNSTPFAFQKPCACIVLWTLIAFPGTSLAARGYILIVKAQQSTLIQEPEDHLQV